jgi:beta-ureidopropionase / N-carbamoyl-L-amino-acid hydrolase
MSVRRGPDVARTDSVPHSVEEAAPVHSFTELWSTLAPIGRDPAGGGYLRASWSAADLEARTWFVNQARSRELAVEADGNGNLWAWWGDPAAGDVVVTGSHLDSVPNGGGYDGALGVASALLAVDELRRRGVAPARPIGVVVFTEEEGSRFGVACLGSRLLCGDVAAERARSLVDSGGIALPDAMAAAGADPMALGPDPERLGRIGAYVELHVEQGRTLVDLGAAVGVALGIWPHGRWRITVEGQANHAGTTRMPDRRDPVLTLAHVVTGVVDIALRTSAHAGIYRLEVEPNATNAVPARVTAWLDARAPDQSTLDTAIRAISEQADELADINGTPLAMVAESVSPAVDFEPALRDRLVARLDGAPVLGTGAGHDAGVLATAGVPAAMLFVRNPTGVSHSPAEHATDADCAAGAAALASVLEDLACR